MQLAFAGGVLTLDAGSGDEALATEQIEAGRRRATTSRPASTRSSCSTGSTALEAPVVELAFTQASEARGDRRAWTAWTVSADADFRYLLMPRPPAPACRSHGTHAGYSLTARTRNTRLARRGARMDLGLVGLGKMGGNMRERIRRAGHTVVGYDRNPDLSDVDSLEEMVEQLPSPEGRLGDGAGR